MLDTSTKNPNATDYRRKKGQENIGGGHKDNKPDDDDDKKSPKFRGNRDASNGFYEVFPRATGSCCGPTCG